MSSYDAVIVGARCAGATLAARLAGAGWKVFMVDKDPLGSDTVSTHVLFPNTIARLEELGVLEQIRQNHDLHWMLHRVHILGREVAGPFTPIRGHDRAICLRREVLDRALAESAMAAGADSRFEVKVASLIGDGTEGDPVTGVVLEDGERIEANWVFGADGRPSPTAQRLDLEKRNPLAGDFGVLFAYWTGLPPTEHFHLEAREDLAFNWVECEDGVHLLVLNGPASLTRGDASVRRQRYLEGLREFPETFDADLLAAAEQITDIRVAPETMMRGFYRSAAGPGWALVGDSGHFKHPATAQGISDAIEQALFVADALIAGDGLDGYEEWRDARADGHYDWSFSWGRFPRPELAGPVFDGVMREPEAAQDMRDTMSRLVDPRDAFSPERFQRWFAEAEARA